MRGVYARSLLRGSLIGGLLALASPAIAQVDGPCSREDLQKATDAYVTAQTKGDPRTIPLADSVDYDEQMERANIATGILSTPLKVDFHRSFFDPAGCASFTELIVTDPAHPYVLGTMLRLREGRVGAIHTLVTDADDWLFNAANTLAYSRAETWTEIPAAERDSRETIIAAADAYLDIFHDKKVTVPWGSPCARLEGGLYTARGAPGVVSPDDSCNVGIPDGVKLVDRRSVVDEALGAVTVLLRFGTKRLPDAHSFRVEKGKLRYVHTITVCKTFNCGFPLPDQLKAAAH